VSFKSAGADQQRNSAIMFNYRETIRIDAYVRLLIKKKTCNFS